jgi:phage tail sheath protein FI
LNPLSVPLVGTINQASLHYSLQGGVDGYTISRPDILGAYDLFNDAETVDLDYILMGPGMNSLDDTIAKAQHIIGIADSRKDCMAFVSPYRPDVVGQPKVATIVDKIVEYYDKLNSSSYVVFDNNYKYIYDKYNDVYRYIPCNADMAGLVLSTTLNQEPWFSPAGFNRGQLRNAIKLAYSPLKDHRDRLYAGRVNPIVAFPGQGIILYGDKTGLGHVSAFDRINVRRLFLVIEEAIAEAAKTQLFELNDEFTRAQFKNIVEPYLRSVQSRRGIVDFLVVCDSSNNPPEAIDRGEFYAEIFVKPTRSINFITLTFTATRTGASFTEITS